jgi:hypothetical protein
MNSLAHLAPGIRQEAVMAAAALDTTSRKAQIRERQQIFVSRLRGLLDAFVTNRMRHAAAEAEHVQLRLSVETRPKGDADGEHSRALPTGPSATGVDHFLPFDPNIPNEATPALLVVRNREGFWVARNAKGHFRGMFLLEQSAVSFARRHSSPVERTMASPSRAIQLDLKSNNSLPVNSHR